MARTSTRTWAALAVGVLVAAVLGTVSLAAPAGAAPLSRAQSCDPAYGCQPSTPPPTAAASCSITAAQVEAGTKVTGTVGNVEPGTEAFLSVDGVVVGHAFATADGSGQQAAGALASPPVAHLAAAQTSSGGLVISTTISVPGTHLASLFGAGFRCDLSVDVTGGVLAVSQDRGSDDGARSIFGGGGLARTGIEIAAFLALAIVLLIAGNTMVQVARRRRRRLAREQNRVRDLSQL